MISPDLINAMFEGCGTLFIALNIRRLWQDKLVRGLDWRVQVFFTAWGIWNIFYYPYLGQLFSFIAGIGIVAANVVYVAMVIYYVRKEKHNGPTA